MASEPEAGESPAFYFLMAATALAFAVHGWLRLEPDRGVAWLGFLFEVGLPLFLAAGLLWHGWALVRQRRG